jgi:hypothetical protein
MRASLLAPVVMLVVAGAMGACAAATATGGFTTATDGSSGDTATTQGNGSGGATASGSTAATGGSTTITGLGGTMSTGTGPVVASAYAHTNDTLFSLDPSQLTLALKQIGKFDCIGGSGQDSSMTDLAVNEAGDIWAISSHNVYAIEVSGTTAHCKSTTKLSSTDIFYGLSFAPAGVIGAKEILVAGNTAGELWAIDTSVSPASVIQHGTMGTVPANDGHGHNYPSKNVGKAWELSGDVVFLANGANPVGFATVRDCPTPPSTSNCNTTDTLIEINLGALATAGTQSVLSSVRGQVVKAAGCTDTTNASYGSMYGIAAYEDKVFGFSHQGFIVDIDNTDGSACLVLETMNDDWAGAAITTVAPVKPPPTN